MWDGQIRAKRRVEGRDPQSGLIDQVSTNPDSTKKKVTPRNPRRFGTSNGNGSDPRFCM